MTRKQLAGMAVILPVASEKPKENNND